MLLNFCASAVVENEPQIDRNWSESIQYMKSADRRYRVLP